MITIDLIGRLGNQMFQYAVCRTVAEKKGYQFHIPKANNNHGQNISNYFNLDMGVSSCNTNRLFSEDHTVQKFNIDIFNISDNTKIWGFFQTEKYFIDNESNIKSWFKVQMDDVTESILEKYPIDDYCYIHFRGTDYKDWDNGSRFLPISYYKNAMNEILKIKELKFLIITDDIELASEYFPNIEIISNDMMVDFKLLYYSKYCIVTNSTFSWWAAWLSDKICVIAPNNWLNYNNPELGFYPADIKTNKFQYVNKL